MAKSKGRGSVKLFGKLAPSKSKVLQQALRGWKKHDWHELGTPDPEIITATMAGRPRQVAGLVDTLMGLKEVREIDILVNGQPKPELAQVRFQLRTSGP